MDSIQRLWFSRQIIQTVLRPRAPLISSARKPPRRQYATTHDPSKPIVLEKPDKFRPPSHPQRLNRRPPRQYPGAPLSEGERRAQEIKRYPHTFPNPGTNLHWFLTNRWIHFTITMGTLSLLAFISLTQSFLHTSPFAHLVPSLKTLPFHPITYFSEMISVLKLHTSYRSELVAQKRAENMLNVQKRRIYRRAHGMEDLDALEDQGIDVRDVVPWDDGLTKGERERGGRREPWKLVPGGGSQMYDPMRQDVVEGTVVEKYAEPVDVVEVEKGVVQDERPRRKVKRWFGIWE